MHNGFLDTVVGKPIAGKKQLLITHVDPLICVQAFRKMRSFEKMNVGSLWPSIDYRIIRPISNVVDMTTKLVDVFVTVMPLSCETGV